MGKPARKIKDKDGDAAKTCPISGKGGKKCEAKAPENEVAAKEKPEVTNIDENGDSDDEPVVTRRTTRSRSRKAE